MHVHNICTYCGIAIDFIVNVQKTMYISAYIQRLLFTGGISLISQDSVIILSHLFALVGCFHIKAKEATIGFLIALMMVQTSPASLLLRCGDVETNPGPGLYSGEDFVGTYKERGS